MKAVGGNRRYGMALVEHLLTGHDIGGYVPQVDHRPFAYGHRLIGRHRQVLAGDHCLDARQLQCFAHVDGLYPGVSVRTAQDLPVEEVRCLHVCAEFGPAGYLVHTVVAYGSCSHHLVFR